MQVHLVDGASVQIEAVTPDGNVYVERYADGVPISNVRRGSPNSRGDLTVTTTIGEGTPDAVIRVWLGAGSVWVIVNNEEGTQQ